MWPFPGYYGYYPPVYASTSCPDRRTNTRPIWGEQTLLGSGANHHDLISFSLINARESSDETLIVRNPVRDHHLKGLQTSRLEALFGNLSDLQESRVGQPDEEFDEGEMRQMTLDTLAEVLQRRKRWSGDDDGVDLDGDKEDD